MRTDNVALRTDSAASRRDAPAMQIREAAQRHGRSCQACSPTPATRTDGIRMRRQDNRHTPHSAAARRGGHKKSDRSSPFGDERPSCWGIRTRTRKNRTRICCVANYTIPQAVLACNSTLAVCECKGSAFLYTGKASAVFFQKNLKKLTKHAFGGSFLAPTDAPKAVARTMFAPYSTGMKSGMP